MLHYHRHAQCSNTTLCPTPSLLLRPSSGARASSVAGSVERRTLFVLVQSLHAPRAHRQRTQRVSTLGPRPGVVWVMRRCIHGGGSARAGLHSADRAGGLRSLPARCIQPACGAGAGQWGQSEGSIRHCLGSCVCMSVCSRVESRCRRWRKRVILRLAPLYPAPAGRS